MIYTKIHSDVKIDYLEKKLVTPKQLVLFRKPAFWSERYKANTTDFYFKASLQCGKLSTVLQKIKFIVLLNNKKIQILGFLRNCNFCILFAMILLIASPQINAYAYNKQKMYSGSIEIIHDP